jgi:hypothetical protein
MGGYLGNGNWGCTYSWKGPLFKTCFTTSKEYLSDMHYYTFLFVKHNVYITLLFIRKCSSAYLRDILCSSWNKFWIRDLSNCKYTPSCHFPDNPPWKKILKKWKQNVLRLTGWNINHNISILCNMGSWKRPVIKFVHLSNKEKFFRWRCTEILCVF